MAALVKNMTLLQESTSAALNQLGQKVSKLEDDGRTVRKQGQDTFKCFNCQGRGHIARYCLKPTQKFQKPSRDPPESDKRDKSLNE